MNVLSFELSDKEKLGRVINAHIQRLAYPMDSWLEDKLTQCEKHKLTVDGECAGYCGLSDNTLSFFYVLPEYFKHAPALLETLVTRNGIDRIFVMTQDSLLCSLISEWDYEIKRSACFFVDAGPVKYEIPGSVFRIAALGDSQTIRNVCGDFFDDASCGFTSLEERIKAGTIFMLEENGALLGCGIVEMGMFCKDCVSIGMFTNPQYRNRGVAKALLINLKEWAYGNGLKPVAGCWYYNTVSRRSLESAGMIAAAKGFEAILIGKEKLPLRTGNPPGELIE